MEEEWSKKAEGKKRITEKLNDRVYSGTEHSRNNRLSFATWRVSCRWIIRFDSSSSGEVWCEVSFIFCTWNSLLRSLIQFHFKKLILN